MATVSDSHIRLDDRGVAWIDDTNIKVIEIVLEHIAHGSSPEEICDQHNGYLTMAHIATRHPFQDADRERAERAQQHGCNGPVHGE